jgi:polyhydroxyalkanoate synthase
MAQDAAGPAQLETAPEPELRLVAAGTSTAGKVPAPPFSPIEARHGDETDPLDEIAGLVDHAFHEYLAKTLHGISPMAIGAAFADWAVHLALSPGKQFQLTGKAARKWTRFSSIAAHCCMGMPCPQAIEPLPQDKRFVAPEWKSFPYNLLSQAFLLQQQWLHNATTGVDGVTKRHQQVVAFVARQLLDVASPSNFILTNPVVLRRTQEIGGLNLINGYANLIEDWASHRNGKKPADLNAFLPGRDVALTQGKVVYRNRLIELIQYAPKTAKVRAEPILFVPAWIMKYYILDLSPSNSLVRYLVEQGFTVFMISWHNPGEKDRDLGMEAYRREGVMAALEAIQSILPGRKIHAAGYCLGGTLLSIAAASLARDTGNSLKTLTFFATQVDFTEAGELTLFINESQITFLEGLMSRQGYLSGEQMAGAFQLLRTNDLIWSRVVQDYLLGERRPIIDLMAWNADTTRLPYRMHSEYLRHLFLDNDLAEGRFMTDKKPVALTDIHVPIFAVGTERDHVAPWRSAFKIDLFTNTEVTFLLTTGGHNAGVISEPGHKGRHYRVHTQAAEDPHLDPDRWLAVAKKHEGSWWPEWVRWLSQNSSALEDAPRLGAGLGDAPGTYVLET